MMHMHNNNIRIAKKITVGTIISGLLFLAAFYFTYNLSFAYGGAFFGFGIAGIVITILISALIAAKRQNHPSENRRNVIFWNLLTLVILAFFTAIGIWLMNSTKIVVTNNLNSDIKNVFITGCQNFEVENIHANTSRTIILNNFKNTQKSCDIGIRYTTDATIVDEVLLTSITNFKAEKINYEIN